MSQTALQVFYDLEGCFVYGMSGSYLYSLRFMKDLDMAFQQHYRPLCLYALHYLHDVDEAEDIVQDCFVRMVEMEKQKEFHSEKSHVFQLPSHLKAFLYTSVRNACIDRLRRKNPLQTDFFPSSLQDALTDEDAAERSFREARLWTAIEQLPERCREIFLMSKRDGMTYREIAIELQLSEKTVEHQISKALKALRGKKEEILYVVSFLC